MQRDSRKSGIRKNRTCSGTLIRADLEQRAAFASENAVEVPRDLPVSLQPARARAQRMMRLPVANIQSKTRNLSARNIGRVADDQIERAGHALVPVSRLK